MIDEARVQKAVDFLSDSAEGIGRARAEMERAEAMLRHIRALATVHSSAPSAAAREAEAYASETYRNAIDDHAKAVEVFEVFRARREAEIALIDAWRSMSANQRGRV